MRKKSRLADVQEKSFISHLFCCSFDIPSQPATTQIVLRVHRKSLLLSAQFHLRVLYKQSLRIILLFSSTKLARWRLLHCQRRSRSDEASYRTASPAGTVSHLSLRGGACHQRVHRLARSSSISAKKGTVSSKRTTAALTRIYSSTDFRSSAILQFHQISLHSAGRI